MMDPDELDRLIRHLRSKPQSFAEHIGGWLRPVKTDDCLAADYLEALRAELPAWQISKKPRLPASPGSPAKQLGTAGGLARAKNLTPEQRTAIARKAAAKRWGRSA